MGRDAEGAGGCIAAGACWFAAGCVGCMLVLLEVVADIDVDNVGTVMGLATSEDVVVEATETAT